MVLFLSHFRKLTTIMGLFTVFSGYSEDPFVDVIKSFVKASVAGNAVRTSGKAIF